MSRLDINRPKFTHKDALRIAEEVFGITGNIKELPSERDQNFFIKSNNGNKFVLKFKKENVLDSLNSTVIFLY